MKVQTIQYGPSESHVGDLYVPVVKDPPVICLLHGGFWKMPYGREEFSAVASDLAARGYAVWNAEYRRVGYPGGGWPGTFEDVCAAIDYLDKISECYSRLDLQRVAVVGHSAGGHLALRSCIRSQSAHRTSPAIKIIPKAVVGLAPIADLHTAFIRNSGNGAVKNFMGGSPQQCPDRYKAASPIGLLPLGVRQLVLHGSADTALAQVPYVRPQLGLSVHGRPNVFSRTFSKVPI